jgi:hypothetical protein
MPADVRWDLTRRLKGQVCEQQLCKTGVTSDGHTTVITTLQLLGQNSDIRQRRTLVRTDKDHGSCRRHGEGIEVSFLPCVTSTASPSKTSQTMSTISCHCKHGLRTHACPTLVTEHYWTCRATWKAWECKAHLEFPYKTSYLWFTFIFTFVSNSWQWLTCRPRAYFGNHSRHLLPSSILQVATRSYNEKRVCSSRKQLSNMQFQVRTMFLPVRCMFHNYTENLHVHGSVHHQS